MEIENKKKSCCSEQQSVGIETVDSVILNLHEIENNLDKDESANVAITTVELDEIDGHHQRNSYQKQISLYADKRNIAEGMMDIALLTANANQLRFLITYNYDAKTFYVNAILIVLSLMLQVAVGIALIFKTQMKNRGKLNQANRTNEFLVVGVFMVTVINVFVAAFTTTDAI